MDRLKPRRLIAVGSCLVLAGWVVPFLMVLRVLEASFALLFLGYAALLSGMVVGLVGAVQYRLSRGEDGER